MFYSVAYSVRQGALGLFCFYNVTGHVAASFCTVLFLLAPFRDLHVRAKFASFNFGRR
jgi:hypothetical protein